MKRALLFAAVLAAGCAQTPPEPVGDTSGDFGFLHVDLAG
jgi:hypothetical protein